MSFSLDSSARPSVARAHYVADQLGAAGVAEPNRLRVAVETLADIDQIDRGVVDFALAEGDEAAPQTRAG